MKVQAQIKGQAMHRVILIGRPNTGKSSLFNALLGRREAVVASEPGVTRDVKEGLVERDEGTFTIADTGGLWSGDSFADKVREKVEQELIRADLVLMVVDGRQDLVANDIAVAEWLRKTGKPVLLVATKIDDPKHENYLGELHGLGFGEPIPTSAAHRRGLAELVETITEVLGPPPENFEVSDSIRLGIIGRPNAGKSSLVNAILGQERVIVSEIPGTTRDTIDLDFEFEDQPFVLVDTAGIRKRPESAVEMFAIQRSHRVITDANVVVLVVDPNNFGGFELRLANEAAEAGTPLIVVVTKWDTISKEARQDTKGAISRGLSHLHKFPVIFTSTQADNQEDILRTAIRVYEKSLFRVETARLNRELERWLTETRIPNFGGHALKIFYVTQVSVAPPTFVFFVNQTDFVTRPFTGYLRNRLTQTFDLQEVPVRLEFRPRRRNRDSER